MLSVHREVTTLQAEGCCSNVTCHREFGVRTPILLKTSNALTQSDPIPAQIRVDLGGLVRLKSSLTCDGPYL